MLKEKILPADSFVVINKTILSDQDRKIISMLYQPIIGSEATILFFSLWSYLDKLELMSTEYTHHHLMTNMRMRLDEIIEAREKLEAIGLLRTYIKKDNINSYIYELYSPVEPIEFFNNPILNVSLYNNVGKSDYEDLKQYFKIPKLNLKDYEEISCSFSDVFESTNINNIDGSEDLRKVTSNKLSIVSKIDIDNMVSLIPDEMFNIRTLTKDTKDLIYKLSFIYNLDDEQMSELIRNSINEKGMIDKTLLRKSCRNYYQFENYGNLPTFIYNRQPEFLKKPKGDNSKWAKMVYTFENITPYQLLKAKYKGAEPTDRDKKLIESLLIDQKLNPGVVNVLISYVLKVNNEQLTKSYVETIAGQWKRLNIETVEEAMKITEKEHKKFKKIVKPTEKVIKEEKNIPAWFNKEQDVEDLEDSEREELDKILAELV